MGLGTEEEELAEPQHQQMAGVWPLLTQDILICRHLNLVHTIRDGQHTRILCSIEN